MQERVVDRADKPDKPNRANNRGGGRRLGADARAERRYTGGWRHPGMYGGAPGRAWGLPGGGGMIP